MQPLVSPLDVRPVILSDTLATLTPVTNTTTSVTINVTKGVSPNNDYPDGIYNSLKNGWQLDTPMYAFVNSITMAGVTHGTITVKQVLNSVNVPIGQRSFYTVKQGWLKIPLSFLQYPEDATTVSLVVDVTLPSGSTPSGSCKLFLGM